MGVLGNNVCTTSVCVCLHVCVYLGDPVDVVEEVEVQQSQCDREVCLSAGVSCQIIVPLG